MDLVIAGEAISTDKAMDELRRYPPQTLLNYDLAGTGKSLPSDGVTLVDLGRMAFINPDMTGNDAAALMIAGETADWSLVNLYARLEEADPEFVDGLWDRATILYLHFKEIDGIGTAKASKLLHIKRPLFFPVLDGFVCHIYRGLAEKAATAIPRLRAKALFWEAIRRDLRMNVEALGELRDQLSSNNALRIFLPLSDLRLIDIVAWQRGKKATDNPRPC